ncbi:hypothetical protein DSM3645_15650 [Blastopirellula marina DSM 3645]|uniref:Uncharacterized protein n=1 Tax=Blastopirellula marina DSM 3645 TaxID=314230 RepID=A3ZZ44_9BACT|nr:hypothetical protein DSM3645_15650 [Blastopirellula marina DSM 3645]
MSIKQFFLFTGWLCVLTCIAWRAYEERDARIQRNLAIATRLEMFPILCLLHADSIGLRVPAFNGRLTQFQALMKLQLRLNTDEFDAWGSEYYLEIRHENDKEIWTIVSSGQNRLLEDGRGDDVRESLAFDL